jgi:hypothetical protein
MSHPRPHIVVRDLGSTGVPHSANYSHTSFRLDATDRRLMRELARRTNGGVSMSQWLRMKIREEAKREGIK